MTRFPAALVLLAIASHQLLGAAQPGVKAAYVGGTVNLFQGRENGRFDTGNTHFLLFETKQHTMEVPYDRVNLIEYGQKVDTPYTLALLISPMLLAAKKRQHFVTVGYRDEERQQQVAIFQVDRSNLRVILMSLQAKTGRKVGYQDEEARRAGME